MYDNLTDIQITPTFASKPGTKSGNSSLQGHLSSLCPKYSPTLS